MDFIDEINEKFPNNTIHLSLKAKLFGKVLYLVIRSNNIKIGFVKRSEAIRRKI